MSSLQRSNDDPARVFPGPVLLLAGPGTGKTHQLARRVKWLIQEKKVDKDHVTVITFTGEAARNMRARLSDEEKPDVYLPPEQQPLRIATIHSLGFSVIREKYRHVGLRKGFTVLNRKDLRELLFRDAAQIQEQSRDGGDDPEECRRKGSCVPEAGPKCRTCEEYQAILRRGNVIDYDDQIYKACEILKADERQLRFWQSKAQHLLVDEYQDINEAQYKLIRLLSEGQEEGLYVAGDDDQSIYNWRGGTPVYVREFKKHYGQAASIVDLPECRRCPQHVLDAARAFISGNPGRIPKRGLQSTSEVEFTVKVHYVASGKAEARMIAAKTKEAMTSHDVMILIPRHSFAEPIKKALRDRRIGYDCKHKVDETGLGALNDAVAWLNDPKDNFALRLCMERVIQNVDLDVPFDGRGKETEGKARTLAKVSRLWLQVEKKAKGKKLWDVLESTCEEDLGFIRDMLKALRQAYSNSKRPAAFMEAACRILRPWPTVKGVEKEIAEWVEDAKARNITGGGTLARIMTMQGAKGLGGDVVFVVGLDEQVFPSNIMEVEEAERLFYVSMTRTKKQLHLFHSRTRRGDISLVPAPKGEAHASLQPSPFLLALPDDHIEKQEYWPRRR